MFVQVIQGRTAQPEALAEAFDRWKADLSPGATGWLGSTGGVTEDGRLIAVARFESEETAMANSARPEQDAWWAETAKLLEGEATFRNTMVMYFTSEAEAREGERKEPPPELRAQMEEMNKLRIGEPEFFDLKQPILSSPD